MEPKGLGDPLNLVETRFRTTISVLPWQLVNPHLIHRKHKGMSKFSWR